MRVFWAHGYDGTSVAMLQEATGLMPPSIYNAFGSKAGLYSVCLDHYSGTIGVRTNAALMQDPPGPQGLQAFLVAVARQFSDRKLPAGCMISTAALDLGPAGDAVAGQTADRRAAMMKILVDYVRRAQRSGSIDAGLDPKAVARLVGAVVQGMSVQAKDGATTSQLLGVAELAARAWT